MQIGVRIPFTGRIELGGRNMPIIEAGGLEKSISAWQYSALADSPSNKAFEVSTWHVVRPNSRKAPGLTWLPWVLQATCMP